MKKEAMLYETLESGKVHCLVCAHSCIIDNGRKGICQVRVNDNGKLFTLVYKGAIASHIDPIEKKPLYHFFPGSRTYSIATLGCNFKCGFCQNWQISQINDKNVNIEKSGDYELSPEEVVREARRSGVRSISYTYTEPTIFFEYAYDTAKLAHKENIYNIFVTNGFMTKEALDIISPYLDACNIDLKSFSDDFYRKHCGARLMPVLDSIKYLVKLNKWVEITTLLIPGVNDSTEELENIAKFIKGINAGIPWHISRFHPDFNFTRYNPTPVLSLRRAVNIGIANGLKYVYLGNSPEGNDTFCYNCQKLIIKRSYMATSEVKVKNGKCSFCKKNIEGVWA